MKISSLKRDSAAIEAGQWIDNIPQMGDLRLRVRGFGSKAFVTAQAKLARAVPKDERMRDGQLFPATAIRVLGEAAAEALLLEWDGLTDDADKPLAYDAKLAKTWCTEPDYRHFLDAVVWASQVVENGRSEQTEAIEKN